MSAMGWDGFQRDVLAELGLPADAWVGDPRAPVPVSIALRDALARAAGCMPDAFRMPEGAPDCATPAGKRALWPQLRRMRAAAR